VVTKPGCHHERTHQDDRSAYDCHDSYKVLALHFRLLVRPTPELISQEEY
jgi:hypothetical protein